VTLRSCTLLAETKTKVFTPFFYRAYFPTHGKKLHRVSNPVFGGFAVFVFVVFSCETDNFCLGAVLVSNLVSEL
jgi:hypothetical protein